MRNNFLTIAARQAGMLIILPMLVAVSCGKVGSDPFKKETQDMSLQEIARMMAELPLGEEQLREVHGAVTSSSDHGYDEEYTMRDIFLSPGAGVGASPAETRAGGGFEQPLRSLIESWLGERLRTRAGDPLASSPNEISVPGSRTLSGSSTGLNSAISRNASGSSNGFDSAIHTASGSPYGLGSTISRSVSGLSTRVSSTVEDYIAALTQSDAQIYWPYSDSWDGETMPVITFDPLTDTDTNVGYALSESGLLEEVIVSEEMASERPVWVINRNDDSAYESLEMLRRRDPSWGQGGSIVIRSISGLPSATSPSTSSSSTSPSPSTASLLTTSSGAPTTGPSQHPTALSSSPSTSSLLSTSSGVPSTGPGQPSAAPGQHPTALSSSPPTSSLLSTSSGVPSTGPGQSAESPSATSSGPKLASESGSGSDDVKTLILKDFTMNRNYDCWFAGASEFFVKCGAVEDFKAKTEAEMLLYSPSITDFMIVVKRSQVGQRLPFNAVLVSDWTDQLENFAFMITEDDGGTRTTWKTNAEVKVKSKTYGFDVEIPYNSRDDIVWRGKLSSRYFTKNADIQGHFGDVSLTFSFE